MSFWLNAFKIYESQLTSFYELNISFLFPTWAYSDLGYRHAIFFLMLDLIYQNGSSWLGLYHSSASSKRCSICRATLPSKCVSFVALTSYHRTLPRRLGWKVKISAQTPQPTWLLVKILKKRLHGTVVPHNFQTQS